MIGAVEILKRERDAAADEMRTLRARIRDLEAAIEVLGAQSGMPKLKPEGDLKPRVEAILKSAGSDGTSPRDIASQLTKSGRTTSDASVSSTLSRLKAEGRVTNRHGTWFYTNETAPDVGTPEADNEMVPEHDEDGFAPPPRRFGTGSVQRPSAFDTDLDDDVPF